MSVDKIVIKATNWVGDTILTTPAIRLLRRQFPGAKIVCIARPWVMELLIDNRDIDELWREEQTKNPAGVASLIYRLRASNFDLGVIFPNSFYSAFLFWAGGVKHRLGYNRDGRRWLLTEAVPVTNEILKVHQVEYYLNILRSICDVDNAERKLILPVNEQVAVEVKNLLEQAGILSNDRTPFIGINPGAYYGSAKRWLPERFAEVASYLQLKYRAKIVITGTAQERPIANTIVELAQAKQIYNLAGEITLRQLIALLSMLDIYITNDSGAMHIAAAVDTPVVAIFGSTDWITTAPYSSKAIIVRKDTECAPCLLRECPTDHRCMTAVKVEDVITAVEQQLERYLYKQ